MTNSAPHHLARSGLRFSQMPPQQVRPMRTQHTIDNVCEWALFSPQPYWVCQRHARLKIPISVDFQVDAIDD